MRKRIICQHCLKLILLVSFLAGIDSQIRSQTLDPQALKDFKSNLPPLGELIDEALTHSPLLDQQESLIRIREYQLKTQKFDWSRNITASADYRYGTVDFFILAPDGTPLDRDFTMANRFNFGTRINLSLFDALDQSRKIKIAREQLKFEEFKMDEVKNLVTNEVIKLYNQLLYLERMIPILSNHKTAQETNYEWAQRAYQTADITIEQFARVVELTTNSQVQFEEVRRDFREAWQLMGELVGTELNSLSIAK